VFQLLCENLQTFLPRAKRDASSHCISLCVFLRLEGCDPLAPVGCVENQRAPAAMAERRKIFGAASNGDVLGVSCGCVFCTSAGCVAHTSLHTSTFFLSAACKRFCGVTEIATDKTCVRGEGGHVTAPAMSWWVTVWQVNAHSRNHQRNLAR
jgi:hypothetical protein